jgi:hypothetical protein
MLQAADRRSAILWLMPPFELPGFEPDPVIEAYKAHIDRTLIRERLERTPAQRVEDLVELARFAEELARAGAALRPGGGGAQGARPRR